MLERNNLNHMSERHHAKTFCDNPDAASVSSTRTSTLAPLSKQEILTLEHDSNRSVISDISDFSEPVLKNGYGEKIFGSGARYAGEFKDGKMEGFGKYIYKGGNASYNGQWMNDQRHGIGMATYPDGTVYVGEFKNGKRHGRGKKTWPDGRVYLGDWKNGMYDGEGTYTNSYGDTYKGCFENDKKHGLGTMRYADGRVWYGAWKEGEKSEELWSIGTWRPSSTLSERSEPQLQSSPSNYPGKLQSRAKGRKRISSEDPKRRTGLPEALNNESIFDATKSQNSTLEGEDGSIYTAKCTAQIKGDGVSIKEYDGNDVYEGELQNEKRHGWGTMRYGDGDVYTGDWVDGKRHGSGKYKYATGTIYVGQWHEGKWNGDGKLTDANGTTYIGQFKNYKKDGIGEITYQDGEKWFGIWEDGKKAQEIARSDQAAQKRFQFDVFFSHNWGDDENGRDNHERVEMISNVLKENGYRVWFDSNQMQGDILDKMTQGVDDSMLFITFVTKQYLLKVAGKGPNGVNDNCKIEFGYAVRRKGVENMVAVVMESSCSDQATWEGAVGGALGNHLYASFVRDDELKTCAEMLVREIKDRREKL